jgi:hypothetical protein
MSLLSLCQECNILYALPSSFQYSGLCPPSLFQYSGLCPPSIIPVFWPLSPFPILFSRASQYSQYHGTASCQATGASVVKHCELLTKNCLATRNKLYITSRQFLKCSNRPFKCDDITNWGAQVSLIWRSQSK